MNGRVGMKTKMNLKKKRFRIMKTTPTWKAEIATRCIVPEFISKDLNSLENSRFPVVSAFKNSRFLDLFVI